MRYDTRSGRHSVHSLQYHLIFCTKYRKELLTGRRSKLLKEEVDRIANDREDIEILNKETGRDHIHILFRATPTTNLAKVVNVLKGVTSRKLRQQFPELKGQKALWSPTYFIASTGDITLDQLKRYVESQGEENEDD